MLHCGAECNRSFDPTSCSMELQSVGHVGYDTDIQNSRQHRGRAIALLNPKPDWPAGYRQCCPGQASRSSDGSVALTQVAGSRACASAGSDETSDWQRSRPSCGGWPRNHRATHGTSIRRARRWRPTCQQSRGAAPDPRPPSTEAQSGPWAGSARRSAVAPPPLVLQP